MTLTTSIHWISEYFHEDGRACATCPHQVQWREAHGEVMSECRVTEGRLSLTECPAYCEMMDAPVDDDDSVVP